MDKFEQTGERVVLGTGCGCTCGCLLIVAAVAAVLFACAWRIIQ